MMVILIFNGFKRGSRESLAKVAEDSKSAAPQVILLGGEISVGSGRRQNDVSDLELVVIMRDLVR